MHIPRPIRSRSLAATLLAIATGCSASPSADAPPNGGAPPSQTHGANDAAADTSPPTNGDDTSDNDAGDAPPPPRDDAGKDAGGPPAKQSLIWVWLSYDSSLAAIAAHKSSFTHVSPALYNLNFDYQSGPPHKVNGNDNYDGLSSKDIADKVHAAGLKVVPLMYAGSGNFGTDQGIQNVLNDANGAQKNFIDGLIAEGQAMGYDGWNLDWEVSNTGYNAYGQKLISFLKAAKAALNAKGMQLSLDLGGWYVRQCTGESDDGLVDLKAIGDSVDLAILEAYAGSLGNPGNSCPANPPDQNCDKDFTSAMTVMCNMPPANVMLGLISPGSNGFADQALKATAAYGFTNVAVWPDDQVFLKSDGMPNGQDWYSVLADFLSQP